MKVAFNHIYSQLLKPKQVSGYPLNTRPSTCPPPSSSSPPTPPFPSFSSSSSPLSPHSYNYMDSMQLLGLEEIQEESSSDPVLTRGAYLSLLFLRHLKIRELQVRRGSVHSHTFQRGNASDGFKRSFEMELEL